jgi:glycosyltransferase involved in cell wall biosynthesis
MSRTPPSLTYVLVTPARNEGNYIEATIACVIAQTRRPMSWIIVSDGSTDDTDAIVTWYAQLHPWMRLTRIPTATGRSFASKVNAFNAGYKQLAGLSYDIIANLDADVTFGEDYFEFLLDCFARDSSLGVAGTPFSDGGATYDYRFTDIRHVSGACQMFRRQCFRAIGGYTPIAGGGIDWCAVTTARMQGWKTMTFTGRVCYHNRPIGTASASVFRARFHQGRKDYRLGSHPLWQVFRAAYQMSCKPYMVGGLLLLLGYIWQFAAGGQRPIQRSLIDFHQREQLQRLKSMLHAFTRRFAPTRSTSHEC